MDLFVFLSQILGRSVVDRDGQTVGRLSDIAMRIGGEVYPKASVLILSRGLLRKQYACIKIEDVVSTNGVFTLKIPAAEIQYSPKPERHDFTLCRDILDQQVVDTDNQKVVRVNDVHLLRVDHLFYLAHVDVGLRGLVRRLEWTPLVDTVVRLLAPQSPYLHQEEFISWKNTQVLTLGRSKHVLRMAVDRKKLSEIPATDIAEIMEDLDVFERYSLFRSLEPAVQQRVFADLATQEKEDLIDQMEDPEAVALIERIPADEATDLLLSLPKPKTLQLMRRMETKTSRKLRKLLGFAKDSAGGLMTTEYLVLKKDALVSDALRMIKDNVEYPGNIYHIYIVDEGHCLLGSTSVRRFINADPSSLLIATCYPRRIFVRTDDGMEEIALLLEKYKFTSLPVLDEQDVLQGVITSDDVMEELISLTWTKYKEKLI